MFAEDNEDIVVDAANVPWSRALSIDASCATFGVRRRRREGHAAE
jgi:hypothetical protein